MAIDNPTAEHCACLPAGAAVSMGLADYVGDEAFARRLALGEEEPPPSPRGARTPQEGFARALPPGRAQNILLRPAITPGAVGGSEISGGAIVGSHVNTILRQWQGTLSGTGSNFLIAGLTEPDTGYGVHLTAVSSTGTPPVGAFVIGQVVKTTAHFSVSPVSVPGTGNSVTYDISMFRLS
jgi:hypothetical protein